MYTLTNFRFFTVYGRYVYYCMATVFILSLTLSPGNVQAQDYGIENLRQSGKAFSSVAKKVSPAVVFIQVEKTVKNQQSMEFSPFGDDFLKHFFGPSFPGQQRQFQVSQQQQRIVGQGSGFIISKDGYILTNNHVAGDADKVTVKLKDGREFSAKTIGADPHTDVAVIKIDAKNLPIVPLGDSDKLEVGEWVVAIGNPFGLSHTLTVGVVSAKGRSSVGLADYENFIQTDAAINPGNSGGPLVDLDGRVIGINTAIFSRNGGYMGISFAIPINMVKAIKKQLVSTGHVIRGYLGIVIQDMTPELAKSFGLDDHKGILVAQVSGNSPAEKAGLKQGDVIVEFNGKTVTKVNSFRNRVALKKPGSRQKVTVLRNRKRKTLTVTIGELPNGELAATEEPTQSLNKLGLAVQTLTPDLAKQFGLQDEKGVLITQVTQGTAAARAGIKAGTVIREVNRKPVNNAGEFKKIVAQSLKKSAVLLLIKDGQYSRYVVLNKE